MIIESINLLFQIFYAINILFAIVIVFFERKNPATTWAWIIVILVLPYIGFILYMCLGLEPNKHRTFSEKAIKDEKILNSYLDMDINKDTLLLQQQELISAKCIMDIPGTEHLNDLVYLNFFSGNGLYTTNNDIEIFHDGNTKFDRLLEDIASAESFIHMQYYILRNDDLGKRIIEALAKKAYQGIEVRLLVDGMGNMKNPKKLYKPLIDAGGKLGIFLPPYFIRINYRNHRKICVIDGKYGYIGGLNIGDEYLGKVKRFGFWRDCHIRVVGGAIHSLIIRFIADWNTYANPVDKLEVSDRYILPSDKKDGVKMQIVSSGPDTKWPALHDSFVKLISEANHSIYIQTPYFVPDATILDGLRIAALSGIDVRIMIPAHPDHPFVYWAALSYLGELINAGVKCYQYEKGFVHSKLITIDSLVTSVGTANLDIRSFKINFEINAFIYDAEKTIEFESKFLEDISDCTVIDHNYYKNLPLTTKIRESISRLISPLL